MNKKTIPRKDYAHNYYLLNKDKKKEYYDAYYKSNKLWIQKYNITRKPTLPKQFNIERKEIIINFN